MWNFLRHNGIREEFITITLNSYNGLSSNVVHGWEFIYPFQVNIGARKDSINTFSFSSDCGLGYENLHISWEARITVDTLDGEGWFGFLRWHRPSIPYIVTNVNEDCQWSSRSIHNGESSNLKHNKKNIDQITLDGEALKEVEAIKYLNSITDEQRGSDADVKARINKASSTFLRMKNMTETQNNCHSR